MTNGSLNTEAIEGGAKDTVVVKAVDQQFIHARFFGEHAIDYPLVQIGGTQAPNAASKVNVVAIVNFTEVIEATGLLGIGQCIFATIVLNGDVALFNVNVRSAVFTHGAQFYKVAVRVVGMDSVQ